MGPILCRHDPSGPHVGPMNLAIWVRRCLLAFYWWPIKCVVYLNMFHISGTYIPLQNVFTTWVALTYIPRIIIAPFCAWKKYVDFDTSLMKDKLSDALRKNTFRLIVIVYLFLWIVFTKLWWAVYNVNYKSTIIFIDAWNRVVYHMQVPKNQHLSRISPEFIGSGYTE